MKLTRPIALLGSLLVAVSIVIPLTANGATTEDEQFVIPINSTTPSYHEIVYQETIPELDVFPHLFALNNGARYICTSTTSANCANADEYDYTSIFPICANSSDNDCIESLSSTSASGVESPGSFQQYTIPNHINLFSPNTSMNLPHTQTPSLWSLPDAAHQFGTQYALDVGIEGSYRADGRNNTQQLFAYLVPVSQQDVPVQDPQRPYAACIQNPNPPNGIVNTSCTSVYSSDKVVCALDMGTAGSCLLRHAFPAGFTYKVKIRVSHEPTAWIHGRMTDPNIAISPLSGGGVSISVSAAPVQIPSIYQGGTWSSLPTSVQNFWLACRNGADCGAVTGLNYTDPEDQRITEAPMPGYGSQALNGIRIIAPLLGDKAAAAPSAWSFHTLPSNQLTSANSCFTNGPGVKGIVTTNSTAYSEGPPSFDGTKLNYQVASPHFNPDGTTPFKGTYNLVIRSDVARCLYGFSNAPISASISVVSADGSNDVATTAVGEKNGWLSLSAANFEFSSPTISVKLSQAATKKTTIVCVKGKLSKSVSGINPACPSGYKKK